MSLHDWLHLQTFLELCRNDERVQTELAHEKVSRARMNKLLDEIFENEYLVWLLEQWAPEIREELGKHLVMASRKKPQAEPAAPPNHKPAARRRRKSDIDADKKYRWVCRACGRQRGVHYYPAAQCGSCGSAYSIEREETTHAMGYPGAKLLERTNVETNR